MKYMVTKWEDFACVKPSLDQALWCHVALANSPQTSEQLHGKFSLFDQSGTVIAQIHSGIMTGLNKKREDTLSNYLDQPEKAKEHKNEAQIIRDLRGLGQDQWREPLSDYLQQVFVAILGMDVKELGKDESLMDVGMDSLVGIEAKTKLEEELDIILPIELLIVG